MCSMWEIKMKLGKPSAPVTNVPPPTKEELDRIIRNWNQTHPKYAGLLEAQPFDVEGSDWYWSPSEGKYTSKDGNSVDKKIIVGLLLALLVGSNLAGTKAAGLATYAQLAEGLKSATISLADWQAGMRELIRMGQQTGMLLAKGGTQFVTAADWAFLDKQILNQYTYLDKFAADIAANPEKWLTGRLDNRMRLYQESAYSAYQNDLRREAKLNGMDEERRVLGAADHCPDCLDYAAQGWQPIGTLPEIGDSVCSNNCRCEFEYRKAGEGE